MNLQTLHAYDHYGYAFIAVFGTFAAVLAIHWGMQRSPLAGFIRTLHGVVPPFINIIGVLFGLTLAFVANDTWNAHDRATNAVYREADALRSLAVLTDGLDEPLRAELRQALAAAATATVDEWPFLAQRQASPAADQRADALLSLIASRPVTQAAGPQVQALMLQQASRLRDDRSLRIGLSQMHLNPLKWLGMAFLGLLTLLSIAAVHVEHPRAALVAITLFALSAAPTAAIVLIQGNPFQEPSFVSPRPILAALGQAAAP
jgi:hypothetical protein